MTTNATTYEQKSYRKRIQEYQRSLKNYIITSRFNTSTWEENRSFVNRNSNKIGCIYCSPEPIASSIPSDMKVFVLEMNNETNKIMGIGLVSNHPRIQKYHVYSNGNYNRYSFIGKSRIDRIDMSEDEEKVMKVFDVLCFTGNTHMKRGQGLRMFPIEMLFNIQLKSNIDLVVFIREMFQKRMDDEKA